LAALVLVAARRREWRGPVLALALLQNTLRRDALRPGADNRMSSLAIRWT
jgi:hypothetical protein